MSANQARNPIVKKDDFNHGAEYTPAVTLNNNRLTNEYALVDLVDYMKTIYNLNFEIYSILFRTFNGLTVIAAEDKDKFCITNLADKLASLPDGLTRLQHLAILCHATDEVTKAINEIVVRLSMLL